MPQMMPINWLMIFLLCLLCLNIIIILMNSLILHSKLNNNYSMMYKMKMTKWKWLW